MKSHLSVEGRRQISLLRGPHCKLKQWVDPDPDHGSQGINAPDQVDLTELLHDIQAPANAGDSKEDKLFFLGVLLKEATYQAMVQWLEDNLVAIFPLLYGDYQ